MTPRALAGPDAVEFSAAAGVRFEGARVLLDGVVREDLTLVVRAGRVAAAAEPERLTSEDRAASPVDARGFLVLPGLINAHTHVAMGFLRNRGHLRGAAVAVTTSPIETSMFPHEAKLNATLVEQLAGPYVLSGLRSGTTCFVDHYYFAAAVARALERVGVRGFVGETIADLGGPFPSLDRWPAARTEIDRWPFSLAQPVVAPHATDTVSVELLRDMGAFARSRGLPLHLHLSQTAAELARSMHATGRTPVELAAACGLLGDRTLAAHLVSASSADIAEVARSGTTFAFCPGSEILYERLPPIAEIARAGVPMAVGTDCAACGDSADLRQEMRTAALFLRASGVEEELGVVLKSGENAATALGRHGVLGELRVGAAADLVFVRLTPDLLPLNDVSSWIVYSLASEHVTHVMVDGQWSLWHRRPTRVSEDDIARAYDEALERLAAASI
jgi:5-methylthioadenosine/S-adenosylhomocysteine deaminase